ncbi:MAG: hypothetical protein ACXABY_13430 [Candidatus Thorarchaeota archaeon]|jgi:hypothetical protein
MKSEFLLSNEKLRRVALAPMCMVLGAAILRFLPDDYVIARLVFKQLQRWVGGGKFDPIKKMLPTLHSEVERANQSAISSRTENNSDGKQMDECIFSVMRSLENTVIAGMNGDSGTVIEAVSDLKDVPAKLLIDITEEEKDKITDAPIGSYKTRKKKGKGIKTKPKTVDPSMSLADVVRMIGGVFDEDPPILDSVKVA